MQYEEHITCNTCGKTTVKTKHIGRHITGNNICKFVDHYNIQQCLPCQTKVNDMLLCAFICGVILTLVVGMAVAAPPQRSYDSRLRGRGMHRPQFEATPTPQPASAVENVTLKSEAAVAVENATLKPEADVAPENAVAVFVVDAQTLDREIMSELLHEHIAAAEEALAAEAVEEVLEDHMPCRVAFNPAGEIRLTPGNAMCEA
jgi:hypothetical protein